MIAALALLSPNEAAKKYRIGVKTVRALCRLGKLKCVLRSGRGPTGTVTLIDVNSAAKVLGVG